MEAVEVLLQLEVLGVSLEVAGDRLRYRPAHRVPPDVVEALRQHKLAILDHLCQTKTLDTSALNADKGSGQSMAQRYHRTYPDATAIDAELAEIERRVIKEGVCLTWCDVLQDLVAFVIDETDAEKVPPGFVVYTDTELWELFSPEKPDLNADALRRIHYAKKIGNGGIVGNDPNPGDEETR